MRYMNNDKRIVFDAIKWTGSNMKEIEDKIFPDMLDVKGETMIIRNGVHIVHKNDYIAFFGDDYRVIPEKEFTYTAIDCSTCKHSYSHGCDRNSHNRCTNGNGWEEKS